MCTRRRLTRNGSGLGVMPCPNSASSVLLMISCKHSTETTRLIELITLHEGCAASQSRWTDLLCNVTYECMHIIKLHIPSHQTIAKHATVLLLLLSKLGEAIKSQRGKDNKVHTAYIARWVMHHVMIARAASYGLPKQAKHHEGLYLFLPSSRGLHDAHGCMHQRNMREGWN